MNSNKEVEFQVCRNRFYTSRFIEMFRFGDGSPSLFIEEPKRSLCSSWYEHSYVKEKDYQLTLFLCEKNSDGKLKCLPNLVNLVPKR
jgi:hypothetical protein